MEDARAGVDLLTRENSDLRTKFSELQRKHANLRREAEAAVKEERRRGAASLQEQLSRLQGPAGFEALKRENLALQERLADAQRKARAEINAAQERARVSEAGRAAAYDLGRRLEAQLSAVMNQASKLHQKVAVGPPASAATSDRNTAVLPSTPVPQQQQHQQQQVCEVAPTLHGSVVGPGLADLCVALFTCMQLKGNALLTTPGGILSTDS